MYRFNKEIIRYLREDLGCKQLIIAGNWKTADSVRLNDAERWSYTAGDVLAVNRYYAPPHLGPDRGWRINKGDRFQNLSVLFNPGAFPLAVKQVAGYPMLVLETGWVPPLGYLSEAPFLAAGYQSLTGVDCAFFVAITESEWADRDRSAWDSASRLKWTAATPMVLGQFPAAALLFRRGDVSLGRRAVLEHRARATLGAGSTNDHRGVRLRPQSRSGRHGKAVQITGAVNALTFLVGPVETMFGSDPAKSTVVDLKPYIDREKKLVHSVTGELVWDYGRGLCTLDSPRSQGATGLLNSVGPIRLRDVTIDSQNSYATVLVVSLDDQPLVQHRSRARPDRHAGSTYWLDRSCRNLFGRRKPREN